MTMTTDFICVDCGAEFSLSYDHQRWFIENGLEIPKRCASCLTRQKREGNLTYAGSSDPSPLSSSGRRWPTEFFEQELGKTPVPVKTARPDQAQSRQLNPYTCMGLLIVGIIVLVGLALLFGWMSGLLGLIVSQLFWLG
jgi:hypothetical protein